MSGTSSKIDLESVLWSEIQEQSDSLSAINLWTPITEYQTFSTNKRNMAELTSISTLALEEENYDPIGSHLIELRIFYLRLYEYHQALTAEQSSKSSKKKKVDRKQKFSIPKYPKNYPFSHSFRGTSTDSHSLRGTSTSRRKPILQCKSKPSASDIERERKNFIHKVLKQIGFCATEDDYVIIGYLSDLLHYFLKKFSKELAYNKSLSENGKPMAILEKTLQDDLGIDGIHALYTFYNERIVKTRDDLYEKCVKLLEEVKMLKDKYPH